MTAVWATQYYVRIQSPESDAVSLESDWHNDGTILTITATTPYDESDVRYLFKNWSTSTGSTSTNKAMTLTIDQPLAIVSEWDKMYSLKTTAGSGGSVTPSGRSWHSEGETLTIKATPNNQYVFIRWEGTGDGAYSGTNPTATITLNRPITQRAVFKYEPNPTLTIDSEYGTKSGEGAYEKGSMVTFSVTPTTITKGDTRYLFQGWESDSPNGYNGPQNSATVQVSSNIIQKAIWKPQYSLKVNTVSGGTISPPTADWYDASSRVTLTATPDTRHKFSHWEIKTDKVSTEESQTLNLVIHEPVEVTPVYVLRPYYTLTIETEHGTAEGAGEYLEGQEASFNVKDTTVNDGSATRYIFQGWTSPNPEGVTSNMNQETIYMTEDINQVAQWKTEYYLSIESPIPIEGEGWYREGKTIVLEPWETRGTIVKNVFTGWSGDYTASAKPIVVLMDSPKHIIVEYTKDYSIAFLGLGLTGLTGGVAIFRTILNKRTAQALLKRQLAKDKILDELSATIKVTPIAGLAKAHNIKEKEVTEIIQEAIDQKEIKGMLSKQADNYIPEDIIKKILRDKLK